MSENRHGLAMTGVVLTLAAVTLACSIEPASVEVERPNIVFIMADDMGWADLGSYGSTAIQTPNLDRLASEGMRFTDAYAGHTVCAPSRCALMTGKHTGHTTVRANAGTAPIRDSDVTVAEVLKQAGYATGGFGKWGLGVMGSEGAAEKSKDSTRSSATTTKSMPTPTTLRSSLRTGDRSPCVPTQECTDWSPQSFRPTLPPTRPTRR